jgi:hypothetical protein
VAREDEHVAKFWGSDEDAETEAIRAQEAAEAEERERLLEDDRSRRLRVASEAGYRWAKGTDYVQPPFDCPQCGAAVTLSGVERHIAWHEQSA